MKKRFCILFVVLCAMLLGACGGDSASARKEIAGKKINDNLSVSLLGDGGKLKNGQQTLVLKFTDGTGKPVEIKAATLNFNMPAMGSMAEMNDAATLSTTDTPGEFNASVRLQMAGEWIAQISYEGSETGKTTIKTTAY